MFLGTWEDVAFWNANPKGISQDRGLSLANREAHA